MLSTFLSQLQGYFSKYFLVGSFFPVLSFATLNGLAGYFVFAGWRTWIEANILKGVSEGAFTTTAIVVAITLIAYVVHGLGTAMRQVLEGRSWGRFGALLIPTQSRRREDLRRRRDDVAMELADLNDSANWQSKMVAGREAGAAAHPNDAYPHPTPDPVAADLARLERAMLRFQPVDADELEAKADEITARLRSCNFNRSPELLKQQQRLGRLIAYARERAAAYHVLLQNQLNANFGAQDVAPTNMGNVANSIQSYALRRYHCNLDSVWSNLLRVAQNDDKTQSTLLEAKTQLDFLVTCCWLSAFSAVFWALVFLLAAPSRIGFLAVALGGPFVAWVWYRLATEQYRSFADVAMTTLDTVRLDLLRAMRIPAPADVVDERIVWENVELLTTFGNKQNFRYDPPKA